jgi:hypothetical protein
MQKAIRSFITELNGFYPDYLKAHSDTMNQVLHFIGATSFFTLLILAFALKTWWLIPVAIFTGYLLPGIGHTHFQQNKSFRSSKPVLCVICAFRLYIDTLSFRIGKKMKALR